MEDKTYKMELTRDQVAWAISEDQIRKQHEEEINDKDTTIQSRELAIVAIANKLGYIPLKDGERREKGFTVGMLGWIVSEGDVYIVNDIIAFAETLTVNDA